MPLLLGPMVAAPFASGMELWNYLKCLHILDIVLRKKALTAGQCSESDIFRNIRSLIRDNCFKIGDIGSRKRINFHN